MRITIHRAFLVIVLALAATWVWAAAMLWRHERADAEFARQVVQPELDRFKRESEQARQAPAPEGLRLEPVTVPSLVTLNESLERMRVRDHYWSLRESALIGLFATCFCWIVTAQIQLALRRRAREAIDRPALANAGHLVGELVQLGRSFVARSKPDDSGITIQVDGRRSVVVFRNLTFISKFSGNPRQPLVELPFSELLAIATGYNKGTAYLHLRTTAGKVFWTDQVRPFDTLAALLDDIVEVNRTDPAAYRAARAREPVVRTPWYGWALLLLAVTGVAALAGYFLSHPL